MTPILPAFHLLDQKRFKVAILGLMVGAAACSSSDTETGQSNTGSNQFQFLDDAANDLRDSFFPVSYTDLGSIPTVGTAEYRGYLVAELSDTTDDVADFLAGEMTIDIDFGKADLVSGSASGFVDDAGQEFAGQITLSDGALDRLGDPTLDATLVFEGIGQLEDVNGNTLAINVDFEGDFLEADQAGVGGDVLGQVTVDGAAQTLGGYFIAEQ